MFKFFKRKPTCKWSELPNANSLTEEVAKNKDRIAKAKRKRIVETIQIFVEQGQNSCILRLSPEDIAWLKNKGYTVTQWCPELDDKKYKVSWA